MPFPLLFMMAIIKLHQTNGQKFMRPTLSRIQRGKVCVPEGVFQAIVISLSKQQWQHSWRKCCQPLCQTYEWFNHHIHTYTLNFKTANRTAALFFILVFNSGMHRNFWIFKRTKREHHTVSYPTLTCPTYYSTLLFTIP